MKHRQSHRAAAPMPRTVWPLAALGVAFALGAIVLLRVETAAAGVRGPSFSIVSPANDSTVSDPVNLRVAVHDAKIGPPSSGRDHLHISIDGGEVYAMYHYRTLSLRLPKGKNTIAVQLAYATHMPAAPVQTVTFTVR